MNKYLANALKVVEASRKALPDGVSMKKYLVMQHLLDNGPRSISEICTAADVQKPNIVPLVDALDEAGYAKRLRDTMDRRVVIVALTDAGQKATEDMRAAVDDAVRKALRVKE